MKRYVIMDILDIVFIPLITYLLSGLMLIQLCAFQVDLAAFLMWGIMAGIVLGVQRWFSNKVVTIGIVLYGIAMVFGFAFYVKNGGVEQAILICVSFAMIIVLKFLMQKKVVKIAVGYTAMAIMIYCSIVNVEFSKLLIGFTIILFLNSISETIALFYSGNVKSLIVIYIMIALITFVMPVSKEPYGWDFVFEFIDSVERVVDRIVTEINYQLADAGVDGIFHFGGTGYSNSMDLSNGLVEQDVEQLVLQGSYTKRNLYLKGNVCNEFTGNSWSLNLSGGNIDYRVDALMTLYAIFQETEKIEELRQFMEIKEHKIIQQNIKTQSLFYPVKLLDISVDDAECTGDMLRASQIKGRGYSYSYSFVDIDYANKNLINILKNSSDIIYEEDVYNRIYTNLKEIYGIELEVIPFDEFCQMAEQSEDMAQMQYMFLGESVSENVKELAEETVGECTNKYDVCKTLERYLYKYNYNKAIQVPDGVNILDWFLFEGKEGYCTHYATALAVMLRSEGVPSRIAEGFLVDYKTRIDSITYSISSNTAHAWVEAYIEGFGWIRLEPTVVNAGNANAVWYSENEDIEDEMPEDDIVEEVIETKEEEESQKISWILMLQLLGGLVVSVIIILLGLLIYQMLSIRKSNNPDIVFMHMISVLEKKYFVKKQSETISEYFMRLRNEADITEELWDTLDEVRNVMEWYWYGDGCVVHDDITKMKNISRMIK